MSGSILIGNRVPRQYFVTSGKGESDITVHAGSYHLALRDAEIESANHIGYSSILPADAQEVLPRPYEIVHGEVMESITATATCQYGDTATAGLTWGWLYDRDGKRHGGLVCEYGGSLSEQETKGHLAEMLAELHANGYQDFALRDITVRTETVTPIKMYGTALVAICFISYEIPVVRDAN